MNGIKLWRICLTKGNLKKRKNRKILILEMMKGCDNFPDHKEITLFDYLDFGNLQLKEASSQNYQKENCVNYTFYKNDRPLLSGWWRQPSSLAVMNFPGSTLCSTSNRVRVKWKFSYLRNSLSLPSGLQFAQISNSFIKWKCTFHF